METYTKAVTLTVASTLTFDPAVPEQVDEIAHIKLMYDDPDVDREVRAKMEQACATILDSTTTRLRRIYAQTRGR